MFSWCQSCRSVVERMVFPDLKDMKERCGIVVKICDDNARVAQLQYFGRRGVNGNLYACKQIKLVCLSYICNLIALRCAMYCELYVSTS